VINKKELYELSLKKWENINSLIQEILKKALSKCAFCIEISKKGYENIKTRCRHCKINPKICHVDSNDTYFDKFIQNLVETGISAEKLIKALQKEIEREVDGKKEDEM